MLTMGRAALERLIETALRGTGQSKSVADFLLAWWNAGECGGFDLSALWSVDTLIAADMIIVFGSLAQWSAYPDSLGYEKQFARLIEMWRPELKGQRR